MGRALEAPSADLLGLLYQCAIDDSLVPALLGRVSQEAATQSVGLLIKDRADPRRSQVLHDTQTEGLTRSYQGYADRDLLLQAVEPDMKLGQITLPSRQVPERELVRTDYYQSVLKPLDIHHTLCASLVDTKTRFVAMCAASPRSAPFTGRQLGFFSALIPHLLSAVEMVQKVNRLHFISSAAWALLDKQPFGVQIFDEAGRPVFHNRPLKTLVEDSGLLQWQGGRLDSADPRLSSWLNQPLGVRDRLRDGAVPLSVTIDRGGERYHLMLAPFDAQVGHFNKRFFALFVSDQNHLSPSLEDQLRRLYALTAREAEIARMLAEGARTADVADALHLAESTVVTHRKSALHKLGVRNQSGLVRTVLALQQ